MFVSKPYVKAITHYVYEIEKYLHGDQELVSHSLLWLAQGRRVPGCWRQVYGLLF